MSKSLVVCENRLPGEDGYGHSCLSGAPRLTLLLTVAWSGPGREGGPGLQPRPSWVCSTSGGICRMCPPTQTPGRLRPGLRACVGGSAFWLSWLRGAVPPVLVGCVVRQAP